MDDQASLNGGRGLRNGSGGVVSTISELGSDIATLAELQAKLTVLDLKESTHRAVVPLGLVLAGLAVALGCIPVGLLGIAWLIAYALSIHQGWAMLLTAAVALVVGLVVAVVAGRRLGGSFETFQRSREELTRNIAWIKTVLTHSGRPGPTRRV
jgi:uncharacterized membrane protein YqjE